MPKYVIERDIPKIGEVTPEQVIAISQKSCSVLNNLGPKFNGCIATLPRTKFTASTSPRTRKWSGSRRAEADSRPTKFLK